jgi:hypothetical protein
MGEVMDASPATWFVLLMVLAGGFYLVGSVVHGVLARSLAYAAVTAAVLLAFEALSRLA